MPDRRPVPALVPAVILDVEDSFREGIGHDGLAGDGGGAVNAIIRRLGNGELVLRVGDGAGVLPWLLDVLS